MLAGASDNKELFSKATTIFQEQIFKNIKNSGEVYDFSERDALSYAVFDLLPLAQAALVAKNNGYDWFEYVSPSGSSLKKESIGFYHICMEQNRIMNSTTLSLNSTK